MCEKTRKSIYENNLQKAASKLSLSITQFGAKKSNFCRTTKINLFEMMNIVNYFITTILLMLIICLQPIEINQFRNNNKLSPLVLALDLDRIDYAPISDQNRLIPAYHQETYHSNQYYNSNRNQQQIIKKAHFAEQDTSNVQRVPVGRPVKFKCVVNNIGDHKVSLLLIA